MYGSQRQEFKASVQQPEAEFFAVRLPGQTLWGWNRRGKTGGVLAHSETLFPDYVACLCDAHGRSK